MTERLVRLILFEKVFQSVAERAPVVVVEASASESPVPETERPLAVEMNPILLLKRL